MVTGAGGNTDRVGSYRDEYRRAHIPVYYRGWLHLLFTFGIGGAAFIACLLRLDHVQPLEWIAVPLTALYVNLAEYWGHRGPMHHKRRGLGLVYERHTRQHHRFFTDVTMPVDSLRDLRAVLFPPVLMTFFLAVFAVPAGLLLARFTSDNVGWLFAATALGYS